MADLLFVGQFIASKAGKTGLTVTVDVDRYTLADGSRTALVTAGSATEGRRGLYHYRLASADLATYQYVATFITADATVDQQEIAALGIVVPDALVGSRLAPSIAGRTLDVAATGEASANVTLWKDATAPAMTGDAFARLGAPAGASVSADIAAIAAASAAGSGAISFPVTINDESSNPIDGVEVWVSTDSAGASVVAGTLHTSALGVATFMLDAGTYYLWRQKSGYNFTNPVTITVS